MTACAPSSFSSSINFSPFAVRTRRRAHTLFQFLPHGIRLSFPEATLQIGNNPLKGLLQHTPAIAPVVVKLQLFTIGTVEDHSHRLFGEAVNGCVEVKAVFLRHRLEIHSGDRVVFDIAPTAGLDTTVVNGEAVIRDD